MIGLPLLAGGLALYLGVRFLARRRSRNVIRLRNGRRVRLVSSVALLSGSPSDLLALEYVSTAKEPGPEGLRLEAQNLVQTVGARAEYAACRSAVVTARPRGARGDDPAAQELIFTFRRGDPVSDWIPTEALD